MKKWKYALCTVILGLLFCSMTVLATETTYEEGIYVEDMSLAGLTREEAEHMIQSYVDSFKNTKITLNAVDGGVIETTAEELGYMWENKEILTEAANFGHDGDVLRCYKELKDLEHNKKIFKIEYDFNRSTIAGLVEARSEQYNREAIDASLEKTADGFEVSAGQTGVCVDVAESTDVIYSYLRNNWDGTAKTIDLVVKVEEPKGTAEELSKVKDIIGTFTTGYTSSAAGRSANVANGCSLVDGMVLFPGDEFSMYQTVAPFSEANGYYMAGSYVNGQVVDSLGGGICQVSTTLYNAVLRAELEVTERYNHSMIVSYVEPSADAAIAESSGKDFKFRNDKDFPIYIEGITTPDKHLTFNIYGVETRDAGREVNYESVIIERMDPDTEIINVNEALPVGYCAVQSAHIGYKAQLWKVVKENGVEVSREQVNSSRYNKSPRSATVGVATSDPAAREAIMAAVATNSIDQVKAVADAYQAAQAAAQAAAEQQAAQAAATN